MHRLAASDLVALATLALMSSIPPAQAARPAAGQEVDESRSIELQVELPRPCIAVPGGQATVLLPRHELERLATGAPTAWTTEAERQALIQGRRAAALLKATGAGSTADANGCQTLQGPADSDAQHLVADFLERGAASVLSSGKAQPRITVRYLGSKCGPTCGRGDILFHVPGEPGPFFAVSWWVS